MIVKAVVPVDKRKCKVFLEGDFAFVLYKSEAARFHIEEGNDLPAKTYEMIEEEILLAPHCISFPPNKEPRAILPHTSK